METSNAESSGQRNSPYPSNRSIRRNSRPLAACFSTAQATHRCLTNSSLMRAEKNHDSAFPTSHSRHQSISFRQRVWAINIPPPQPMRFPSSLLSLGSRRPHHGFQLSPSSTSAPDPTPSAAGSWPGRQPLRQISCVFLLSSSRESPHRVRHFCKSSRMSSAPGKSA